MYHGMTKKSESQIITVLTHIVYHGRTKKSESQVITVWTHFMYHGMTNKSESQIITGAKARDEGKAKETAALIVGIRWKCEFTADLNAKKTRHLGLIRCGSVCMVVRLCLLWEKDLDSIFNSNWCQCKGNGCSDCRNKMTEWIHGWSQYNRSPKGSTI